MTKPAGGRPSKSGARRELKTFRLVPDALLHLEKIASERGVSTSDVLNDMLMEAVATSRPRKLEVLAPVAEPGGVTPAVARFRVLSGGHKAVDEPAGNPKVAHELERLRDSLAGVLAEIEDLMAEQLEAPVGEPQAAGKKGKKAAVDFGYDAGFRDGMLEALETTYALLQGELLISEHV